MLTSVLAVLRHAFAVLFVFVLHIPECITIVETLKEEKKQMEKNERKKTVPTSLIGLTSPPISCSFKLVEITTALTII